MGMVITLNQGGKITITSSNGEVVTIKIKESDTPAKTTLYLEAPKEVKIKNIRKGNE